METRRKGDVQKTHCCECELEFSTTSEVQEHYDAAHIPDYGSELEDHLVCSYCLRRFSDETNFAAHVDLHEFEGPLFSCDICCKCFKSLQLLQFHQGEILHKCPICQKILSEPRLANHLKTHRQSRVYDCAVCSAKIPFQELGTHMKTHSHSADTGSKISICDQCVKAFPSKKSFSQHTRRGHDTYQCDICLAVTFTSRGEYENHRQIHFAGSYPCPGCGKVFTEVAGVRNHQSHCYGHTNGTPKKSTTEKNGEEVIIENCPFCPGIYRDRQEFRTHLRDKHIDVLAYQCQDCNEILIGEKEYTSHKLRLHFRKKCQVCSLEFGSAGELLSHLEIHRQFQQVFVCEMCSDQFLDKESLVSHKLTHSISKVPTKTSIPIPGRRPGLITSQSYQKLKSPTKPETKVNNNGLVKITSIQSILKKQLSPPVVSNLKTQTPPKPRNIFVSRGKPQSILLTSGNGKSKIQIKNAGGKQRTTTTFLCKPCKASFYSITELEHHELLLCPLRLAAIVYKPYRCMRCRKGFMLDGSLKLHSCLGTVRPEKKSFNYMPEVESDVSFILS